MKSHNSQSGGQLQWDSSFNRFQLLIVLGKLFAWAKNSTYRRFADVSDDAGQHGRLALDDGDVRRRRRVDERPQRRRLCRLRLCVQVVAPVVRNVLLVGLGNCKRYKTCSLVSRNAQQCTQRDIWPRLIPNMQGLIDP